MGKITGIIHLADNRGTGSKSAGWVNFIIRKVAHLQIRLINIFIIFLRIHFNQYLIQTDGTFFLITMPPGFVGYRNQTAVFQFFNMASKRPIGNIQLGGQFIHVHPPVF